MERIVEGALRCTLREEPSFVFLSEENKRRPCLNHIDVNPLKSPQPELLDQSILSSLVKLVCSSQNR